MGVESWILREVNGEPVVQLDVWGRITVPVSALGRSNWELRRIYGEEMKVLLRDLRMMLDVSYNTAEMRGVAAKKSKENNERT
jgi:hypothetical protein